jgi:hypothetical protein
MVDFPANAPTIVATPPVFIFGHPEQLSENFVRYLELLTALAIVLSQPLSHFG